MEKVTLKPEPSAVDTVQLKQKSEEDKGTIALFPVHASEENPTTKVELTEVENEEGDITGNIQLNSGSNIAPNEKDNIEENSEVSFNIREVQKPKFLEAPIHAFDDAANRKHIIAVSSSGKGGTGKSTTSMMLSLFFQELNQNTVLVDLDIPFGDIANMLGMSTERSISDFVGLPHDLSDTKVRENMLLTYHNGLKVLPALRDLNDMPKINSAEFVDDLLERLESFSTIIIDLGPNFEPVTLRALEKATEIVYVTDDYETTFHNIFQGQKVLKSKGIDTSKLSLVVNRSLSKNMKEQDVRGTNVQKITNIEKVYFLPMVIQMPKLVDSSNYLVLEKERHPYRKAVHQLIQDLSPELFTSRSITHGKPVGKKKKGFLGLFGTKG